MKLLMYGAGSIGRGFIGPLFACEGWNVVFVDVNRQLVGEMNRRGSYSLSIAAEKPCEIPIGNVSAIDGADRAAVIKEIVSCDLMATALGASVLEKVSPLIAEGLSARWETDRPTLDILICENLKNAANHLHSWLYGALPENKAHLLEKHCGLVETAIGRMVPVADGKADDLLQVTVEEYDFLPVDRAAFKGGIPDIKKLVPYAPFVFYEERKLYLHNMGHAVCAYLGLLQGYEYIWQAVNDPLIRLAVQGAMTESCMMLSERHNEPFRVLYSHAEDLLLRFSNRALGDTCERVGRDPMRKLAADDRLAGALRFCGDTGIFPAYILLGYAAALCNSDLSRDKAREAAKGHGDLSPKHIEYVMRFYRMLADHILLSEILREAQIMAAEARGRVV